MAGYVKLPNDLLSDRGLSDRELRLWCVVRGRNGERAFRGCRQSAVRLDEQMPTPSRRRTPLGNVHKIPWMFKRAQWGLVERGLMVVRRQGMGMPCVRWALAPGIDGDLELRALLDGGEISESVYRDVCVKRLALRQSAV